jgi:hypothetical protein
MLGDCREGSTLLSIVDTVKNELETLINSMFINSVYNLVVKDIKLSFQ